MTEEQERLMLAELGRLRALNAELLEALQAITDAFEHRMTDWENADFYPVYNDARAAIAKAGAK